MKTIQINRIYRLLLPLLMLSLLAIPSHSAMALPSPMVVNGYNVADDPNDGKCDLWEALQAGFQANFGMSPSYHECSTAAGPIVIIFDTLIPKTINLNGKDLPFIHDNITITGPLVTIDGGGAGKELHVFRLAPGASLNLVGLTITNAYSSGNGPAIFDNNQGSINLIGVNITNNVAGNGGGAIETNGSLSVMASSFTGNRATGTDPGSGYGGAISFSGGGTLSISKSNFAGNIASGDGGGAIYILSSSNPTNDIADTVFSGNIGTKGGGAIYNASGSSDALLKIERVGFSGNLSPSGSGGAIWNSINGYVDVSDSSFNLNIAGTPVSSQMGGALYSMSNKLSVTRSAFLGNVSAGGDGGAVELDRGGTTLFSNSTFSGNAAPLGKGGAIMITNTQNGGPQTSMTGLNLTIAANTGKPGAGNGGGIYVDAGHQVSFANTIFDKNDVENCAGGGIFGSQGHNIDSGTGCGFQATGDMQLTNSSLNGPAFNGGPITSLLSMKLSPGSPAIDHGNPLVCTNAPVSNQDQRGSSRPNDGDGDGLAVCDIGAFEADTATGGFGSTPVQPGPIDIGNVVNTNGSSVTSSFQVFNTGKGTLHITQAQLSGANPSSFSLPGFSPITLTNSVPQSVSIACTYDNGALGTRSAVLTLTTDDPNNQSVVFNLKCTVENAPSAGFDSVPIVPGPIVFPDTQVGSTSSASFKIAETGQLTLTVTNPSLSGFNFTEFGIVTGFPQNITNGAGPITVSLNCTPSGIGLRSAQLTLTTNDPTQTSVKFNLACKGIPVPSPALVEGVSLNPPTFAMFHSPYGLAISPDGNDAYVGNRTTNNLEILGRASLFGVKGYFPKSSVTHPDLVDTRLIAVSPDGKNVFAAAYGSNSLVTFTRTPDTGALSNPVSFKNGVGGVTGLLGPDGVAVSPDGNFVYVSASSALTHNIAIFKKGVNGAFGFLSSFSDAQLLQARAITISPDGINLYVTGYSANGLDGNLLVFKRNPTDGTLTKIQTRSQGDCIDYLFCITGLDGMKGANQVAISPDGKQVYLVSLFSDAVLEFNRDLLTGKLSIAYSIFNNSGPITGLNNVQGISISPDGSKVYTASYSDKAVDVFDRDGVTGALTLNKMIQRSPFSGAGASPMLDGASNIAASPDGQIVLSTAYVDQSVIELDYASPVPALTSILPASVQQGSAAFPIVVRGQDFVNGAVIRWNGGDLPTSFINSTELHSTIPAADVSAPGPNSITVKNPGPGGGPSSNFFVLTVTPPNTNATPSIDHITPQGLPAGPHSTFFMDIYGTGFFAGSKVLWNGVAEPAGNVNFVDTTHLIATIVSANVAQPGQFSVMVQNPGPGGGNSNQASFDVAAPGKNPIPSVSGLNPSSVLSHGGASTEITLTVSGSNFMNGSVVRWNGSDRPTKYITPGQLTATIPGSDLSTVGGAGVSVFNPAPGGGESNIFGLLINSGTLPPILNGVKSVQLVGTNMVFTFTGKYFQNTSKGQVNGADRTTQFVSDTEIKITIPVTDLTKSNATRFAVYNPAPDYSISNFWNFAKTYLPGIRR